VVELSTGGTQAGTLVTGSRSSPSGSALGDLRSGQPRPLHEEPAALRDDVQELDRRLDRLADRAEA
jgi:hypothetical protein